MHPLSGSNIGTLATVLARSGGISPRRVPDTALAGLATLGRWPFTTLERLYMAAKLHNSAPLTPPIFIVGHWRSGTTHLYNIMSKTDFAYVPPLATGLPWDLLGVVSLFRPLLEKGLPATRYIDNIPVEPDSPQEDEIALANMTPLSFYHGIYFPKRFEDYLNAGVFFDGCSESDVRAWQKTFLYLMHKLSIFQPGKQLLIKNPVYTARVALLHEMMPQAKFIHINRNPYEVFVSMRNFYGKLFKQLALQDYGHIDIDAHILSTYDRMMHRLEADKQLVPESQFIELRYEDLDRDPIAQIQSIYEHLRIDGFDTAKPHFEAYLSTVKNYKKNKFSYTDEAAEKVETHWGGFLDQWGYRRPGTDLAGAAVTT